MKRLIGALIIVLMAFSVHALGEIKKVDIEKGETVTVDLKVKEGVELNLLDGRHIININKIHKDGADLDIWVFVDGDQRISYVTVNRKQSLKLDLDKDGKGELYVSLNKFFKYDTPYGGRADGVLLDFYYPADEDFESNLITGAVVSEGETIKSVWNTLFVLILLLLILAVLILVITKRLKKK